MLRLSQGPRYCLLTLIVGTVLTILAVAISAATSVTASAPTTTSDILYVAPNANCGGALPCYSTLQEAVDAAGGGATIKVAAGVYTDIHSRPAPAGYSGSAVITQIAYISKTLAIQGGYTLTNWSVPNPISYPTTLDGQRQGRVLFITGAVSPTIREVQIVGGNAAGLGGYVTPGGWGPCDAGGGAYIAMGADGTMGNNHVFSNIAEYGGGLFLFNSPTVLEGNVIQNNIATGEGGGVSVHGYGNEAILNHNHINSNTAMLGGGLCIDNSSSVINANTIQGNKAMNGGGVEIYYATAVLTDNIISSNIATGGGMFAIALGGSSGGGVHLHKSQAVLSGNVVDSNSSSAGGGLHLYESNVTLNENVVTCNAAVSNGGGLWLTRSSVTLGSNTISGNTAGYHGGGLDAVRSSATIVNNVITDNRSEMGGGVYLEGSILRLLHATAARNSGGGVYVVQTTDMPVASSSLAMTNAMLISHTVGITVAPGNTATLNGVLLYGNTTNLGGAGVITVSNAITGDPIFAADGYHLLAGSAAIDRGVNTEVATDIDGRHRPQGAAPDLGADEFPGIGLVISKSGPAWALPGAPITYWLTIQNRGDVDITETLAVTDRVPIGAHPVGYPPQSVITWTFPPTSPIVWPPCDPSYCYQAWAVRFVVTATETITNSDYGARTGGLVVRGEPIVVTRILNHPLYLPLVLRAYPPIRACLVTDVEGIDDHAFNAAAWQGVLDAINEYGIEGKYLESQQPTDYDKHLARFVQEGCDLIIAVGWRLGDATKQSATQNSNKRFTIVDMVYEPPIPNLAGSTFNVDEAAFLAGYLAAGMSKTGKVGTWGGIAIPPVTIYMDGFLAGVNYYNEKNNTHVQVLGWDGWEGLFINNFESVEDGIKASETLADKGADIHLPVTGPAGVGAAIVAQERHLAVIGIDSDWFFTQPGYQDAELTSVIKNANVTVKQAIESVIRRDFSGDVITGTLANGGVSLAPFHTFEDRIPPALKEDLVGIAADIIAGKIKISDYLPR